MKNGKRRKNVHFQKTILNFVVASPFFILHFSFFIFLLCVLVPSWPEFRE